MPQIPSMRANPVYFLLPISIRQAGLTALILLINLPALYPAQAQDEAPQPSAAIMVNHEGYRAADEKVAMVSSALALPFIVQTEAEGVEIVRGLLQLRQPNDPNSGGNIWAADFSVLQATGTYRLQVPGLGVSFPFEVAETRYRPLLLQSLRAIHWLRAGQSVVKTSQASGRAIPFCLPKRNATGQKPPRPRLSTSPPAGSKAAAWASLSPAGPTRRAC